MTQAPTLKRSLSLPFISLYGLGTIVGAGIYVLIGEVAGKAGMYAPIAFVVAACIAGCTAFSYAELSARFPRSAGEAVYVDHAFSRRWLTAATGWAVIATGLVSAATISRGFHGYLSVFVAMPEWIALCLFILVLGFVAAWGISESVWTVGVITFLEVAGLCLVVFAARESLLDLPARWDELLPPVSGDAWFAIAFGAFLAFYAFVGFEDMVNVAEEVKNPSRNLPIAIFVALLVSTCLYLLVALVAVLSLPIDKLAASDAPLADIVAGRGFISRQTISWLSLLAVANGALVQIIMAARVLYGLAGNRLAPTSFALINPARRTPIVATVAATVVVLILALWLPLVTLAELTSAILLAIFTLVNASLLWLKIRGPAPPGIVNYPIWVPAAGATVCIGFLVIKLVLEVFPR